MPAGLSDDEGGTEVEEEYAGKGRDVLGRGGEESRVRRAPKASKESRASEMPGEMALETPGERTLEMSGGRAPETPGERTLGTSG